MSGAPQGASGPSPDAPAPSVGRSGGSGATAVVLDGVAATLDLLERRLGYDVDDAVETVIRIERDAARLGDVETEYRARLLHANLLSRRSEVTAATRMAWQVHQWATRHAHMPLLARSHHLLSVAYHVLGDPAAALEHAICSVELLDETTEPSTRAHHLVNLADNLNETVSVEAARERYREAEQIYLAIGDVESRLDLLNNLAYTEYQAGEPERGMEVIERLRAVAALHKVNIETDYLDTIARVLIGLGRCAEAEETIRRDIDGEKAQTYRQSDSLAENLLTLAEAQRCQGHVAEAQESLDRCRRLCEDHELRHILIRVHEMQAELYAADGRFEEAYRAYRLFHAEAEALHSLQRQAHALTRQTMFETNEARERADRFREQAMRDPLTGLLNRRFVDERLPLLIAEANQTGDPLSVALIDLDHFKRINDTLSHEVGDRVLVTVGELLTEALSAPNGAAASPESFVARMGGEEFLVALPDTAVPEAVERLDKMRVAIGSHPWCELIGDLTLTASVGVTSTINWGAQSALLAAADRNLYRAKHAGRDQVVPDVPAGEVPPVEVTPPAAPSGQQGRRRLRDLDDHPDEVTSASEPWSSR